MRIYDDLRKSVVFFGFEDGSKPGGMNCIGTGFLVFHDGLGYIITAQHVARALKSEPSQPKSDPFLVRVNRKDGTAENILYDEVEWLEPVDKTVDLAIAELNLPSNSAYDCSYLIGDLFYLDEKTIEKERVGVANLTYTVGLFRLLTGEKRSLPITHVGSIALMPGDERVPVWDWTDPEDNLKKKRRASVEAYLVEAQSIGGLSGSPVFVRVETIFDLKDLNPGFGNFDGSKLDHVAAYTNRVRLLGLWQGAWEAPPDEVRAAQSGTVLVPVGMGVVVPCSKIVELLERNDVKARRDDAKAKMGGYSTSAPQAVSRPNIAKSENSNHLNDFNRLLGAAVKPPSN